MYNFKDREIEREKKDLFIDVLDPLWLFSTKL